MFYLKPLNKAIQNTLLMSILGISSIAATQTFANEAMAAQQFNITAGALDQVLTRFAAQVGISLAFDHATVSRLNSNGLQGQFSVQDGLNQILASQPYQAQKTATGYILIAKDQPQVRDMGRLNLIDVTASSNRSSATNDPNVTQLPVITITAEQNGSADDGYLVKNITGAGIWNERSLQDTPYSMSVISKELIENVIAKDMNQIFKMNPTTQEKGEFTSNFGGIQTPNIRGFHTLNPIVNGISYANTTATTPMMQDIERVEIISGATGFLYGGGRVGGAVNYITKKPTIDNLKTLSIGSYGNESYYGYIDLGGQFDDNHAFGYRVNALYQNGELENESEKEQKAISLVFDWKPTDNFYTDIKYSYKDILNNGVSAYFMTWLPNTRENLDIKKNKSYSPNWLESETKSDRFENNVIYNINNIFTLRTNLFYEETKFKDGSVYLYDITNEGIIKNYQSYFQKGAWQKTKNYGANIYFDSKFDTGSISHTLTTGYSLSSNKLFQSADQWSWYDFIGDINLNELKNLAEPDNSLWTSQTIGTQPRKPVSQIQYKNILIGDDIVFNEQWSALLGFNYATVIQTSYSSGVKQPAYDKSAVTPTLSFIYKPIENLTTYITYIESLEAGTIVGNRYANENEILDPYISKQYEIGAKFSLFDKKALLTAALFRIEKANSYEDTSTTVTLGKPTLTQDGKQIHQGLEVGLTGKVTDNLTLMGGVTLMDLSVEKATNKDLEGKKPTDATTKMAKLFAEYEIPYINDLFINAGAYYTGKKYGDNANTDIIPSYTLYDVGLRYKTKIDKYPTTFNLTGQNLTDKVYWSNSRFLGDPRTIAFSVKTQF